VQTILSWKRMLNFIQRREKNNEHNLVTSTSTSTSQQEILTSPLVNKDGNSKQFWNRVHNFFPAINRKRNTQVHTEQVSAHSTVEQAYFYLNKIRS